MITPKHASSNSIPFSQQEIMRVKVRCERTLEAGHVAGGREVLGGEGEHDGAAGAVGAAHVGHLVRQLRLHQLRRYDAAGHGLPPPRHELEQHRRGLAHVVAARAQEPPERQVVHLLHAS